MRRILRLFRLNTPKRRLVVGIVITAVCALAWVVSYWWPQYFFRSPHIKAGLFCGMFSIRNDVYPTWRGWNIAEERYGLDCTRLWPEGGLGELRWAGRPMSRWQWVFKMPLWLPLLAGLLTVAVSAIQCKRAATGVRLARCVECGYSLVGLADASKCPECGSLPNKRPVVKDGE